MKKAFKGLALLFAVPFFIGLTNALLPALFPSLLTSAAAHPGTLATIVLLILVLGMQLVLLDQLTRKH